MPGSTPASSTPEAPAYDDGPLRAAPRLTRNLARALGTRTGAIGAVLLSIVSLAAVLAPVIAPTDPFSIDGPVFADPSAAHPMGTDNLGRDIYSGVVHGARASLTVALAVGLLVIVVGGAIGATAGFRGGFIDDALMRFTEFVQVLPRFFLAIIVLAVFGPGLDRIILVLGLTSWPLLARVVRAEVFSLREREYVSAARALGATNRWVVSRHILPNAAGVAFSYVALEMAQAMLAEASLGFLGLGDPTTMSWGLLAFNAQRFLRVAWWLAVFPGAAIVVAVLGLNLLSDALTETFGGRAEAIGRPIDD